MRRKEPFDREAHVQAGVADLARRLHLATRQHHDPKFTAPDYQPERIWVTVAQLLWCLDGLSMNNHAAIRERLRGLVAEANELQRYPLASLQPDEIVMMDELRHELETSEVPAKDLSRGIRALDRAISREQRREQDAIERHRQIIERLQDMRRTLNEQRQALQD